MATKLECEWCWANDWPFLTILRRQRELEQGLYSPKMRMWKKKNILKFNGKEICCDADWDVIIKGSAERKVDKNAATRIRVFPVEV